MNGRIRVVVNLRSPSVEYSMEVGENRYGRTLRSDAYTVEDVLEIFNDYKGPDRAILSHFYEKLTEVVNTVGHGTYFKIRKGGNDVTIVTDDISFVTIDATGVFKEISEELMLEEK